MSRFNVVLNHGYQTASITDWGARTADADKHIEELREFCEKRNIGPEKVEAKAIDGTLGDAEYEAPHHYELEVTDMNAREIGPKR